MLYEEFVLTPAWESENVLNYLRNTGKDFLVDLLDRCLNMYYISNIRRNYDALIDQ